MSTIPSVDLGMAALSGIASANISIAVPVLSQNLCYVAIPDSRTGAACVWRSAVGALTLTFPTRSIPFTPVYLLPVFYVLQTVAYSLFAPIKYSIFQNAVDSSMRCSLISVQSQMVAVGAILFYLFNAVLSNVAGIRVVLLVALGISSLVYIPALFRLTSQRP